MTIREAIQTIKSRGIISHKWDEIERNLRDLGDEYGYATSGPWELVRTRFHGGGIVSRHRSALSAVLASWRYARGGCHCGCAGVVLASAALPGKETNDRNGYSPYTLCR